jgi:CheY-like chemotaxis protein
MYMMRILLANDSAGSNRLFPLLEGHQVIAAENLSEAKNALSRQTFDLIIAGVHFDDSRAIELLKYLREESNQKDAPFIFVRTRTSAFAQSLRVTMKSLEKCYEFAGYVETDKLGEDDKRIRKAIFSKLKERHTA